MNNLTYNWYQKLSVYYLTFALVIEAYGYGGILNWGRLCSLLLIAIVIIMLLKKKNLFKNVPSSLNVYFIWLFLVALVSATSISDIVPFGQIEQYLLVVAIFSFVRYDKFLNLYKKFAYFCVWFVIIQKLTYQVLGVKFSGMLGFLPIDLGLEDNQLYLERLTSELGRFSAFFSEPAKFTQYVIPLLTIQLFSANNAKDWYKVILITISIIFTKSGNGTILLAIVLTAYIIKVVLSYRKALLVLVPIFLTGAFIASSLYLKSEHGKQMLDRREEVSSGIEISSGFIRMQRGYYVYDTYSDIEKIIGVNNIKKLEKRIASSKANFTFGEKDYYANTFQKFLLNTGIVGAIMFFVIIIGGIKNNTPEGKTIIMTFTVMSFFAATYLSTIMYLYLYLAYNMKLRKQIRENNNIRI